MDKDILIAFITGLLPLIGVIVTVNHNDKKNEKRSNEQKALIVYRLDELEKKQDKYNHLQERMSKVEKSMAEIKSDVRSIETRITDLHNQ